MGPKQIEAIQVLIKEGKTQKATRSVKSLISKNARNVDAHYLLAQIYLKEDKPELALMELKTINQLSRFSAFTPEVAFRKLIAGLFIKFNQLDEALKEYLMLAGLEPYVAEHFFKCGEMFDLRGNSDKSLNYFRKTLQLDKNHAGAHYKLGSMLYRSKKEVEARVELEAAIRLDSDNFDAYFYMGKILKDNGDFGAALQNFERSEKSAELRVRSIVERGSCFMSMNNFDQAIYELKRGIKQADSEMSLESLYGRYFLAKCYEKIRQIDKAIEQWEKVYAVKPTFQDVAKKLSQYQDLRTDDKVKDYLTSSNEHFVLLCQEVIKNIKLEIRDVTEIRNGCQILAAESESKWRNARKMPKLIWFIRIPDLVNEVTIRHLLEEMRKLNVNRGAIFTSSGFSKMARDYAESRPVELFDKEYLKEALSKAPSNA
jgi:tetratricopeptide (TPR) repeat protein